MATFAFVAMASTHLHAQTPPETMRINVVPPKPAIRSITLGKRYKPIINRDDEGVIVDTLGSADTPPPCETDLEVTLENSRVLHRKVNICTGNTLSVDVASDGKPGSARVIEGTAGQAYTPKQSDETVTPAYNTDTATPSETGNDTASGRGTDSFEPLTPDETAGPESDDAFSRDGVIGQDLPVLGSETQPGQSPDVADTPSDVPDIVSSQQDVVVTPSEDRVWNAIPGNLPGARTTLTHGVPQTDDNDFFAVCQTQSGNATIVFSQTSANTREGAYQTVRVSAGGFDQTYEAVGSSTSNQYGQSFPQSVVPMTDPLWETLIRESEIRVEIEGVPPYSVSLKGSANPVKLFVATCGQPQQIVSEDGIPVNTGEEAGADVPCSELGRVRSIEGVRPGQIVFRNMSREPVEVHWIDYSGGERRYARLEPGQILEQQTYVSHAWMVRSASGQCRGIYVTRTPYREVVIKGAPQPTAPNPSFGFPNETTPPGPIPPGNIGGGLQPSDGNYSIGPQTGAGDAADYLCTAGVDLHVTFSPDGRTATVAEMGYGVSTLTRQGNGFYYAGQGQVLKGDLQNATWSRPGLSDVFCARR
ncbi:hypothetical protein [uncultured Roseibium sp.]|uniref:VHL beta domain-containing protein n=1 Tax=uncultured Roseibium sp. TaxID=1936171 RepID=UPI003216601E